MLAMLVFTDQFDSTIPSFGGSCVTKRMVKTFSLFDKLLRVYGRPLKSCYASETMCQQDTRGRGLCCTEHRLVLPVITHLHLRNKDGAMLELCSELRVRINLTTEEAARSQFWSWTSNIQSLQLRNASWRYFF